MIRDKLGRFVKGKNLGHDSWNWKPENHIFIEKECACGCGQKFTIPKSKKQNFIWGHNTNIRDKKLCHKIAKKIWITRRKMGFVPTSPLCRMIKESNEYKHWRTAIFK